MNFRTYGTHKAPLYPANLGLLAWKYCSDSFFHVSRKGRRYEKGGDGYWRLFLLSIPKMECVLKPVAGNDLHVTANKALFLTMINKLCPEEKCFSVSSWGP